MSDVIVIQKSTSQLIEKSIQEIVQNLNQLICQITKPRIKNFSRAWYYENNDIAVIIDWFGICQIFDDNKLHEIWIAKLIEHKILLSEDLKVLFLLNHDDGYPANFIIHNQTKIIRKLKANGYTVTSEEGMASVEEIDIIRNSFYDFLDNEPSIVNFDYSIKKLYDDIANESNGSFDDEETFRELRTCSDTIQLITEHYGRIFLGEEININCIEPKGMKKLVN